ncbi:hypothetical protein MPSEU_000398600 [Mayamaea pseudoterrestris]|nr:hypothetical protein MPSEU_000398600 [Mayamaea pseudoterrestris]
MSFNARQKQKKNLLANAHALASESADAAKRTPTAPVTPDQVQLQSFRAMAFGRDYYHCIGSGMRKTYYHVSDNDDGAPALLQAERDDEQHDDECYAASEDNVSKEKQQNGSRSTSTARLACYTSWESGSSNTLAACWSKQDTDDSLASIACTAQSTIFLTKAGHLYQTGMLHGRLHATPQLVSLHVPLKCVQVAAGRHFVLGRLEGGRAVVSFGAGHFGQLGVVVASSRRGNRKSKSETEELDDDDDDDDDIASSAAATPITFTHTPVVIERLLPQVTGSPCASVAAGDWHALALTESGRVWAWGANRMNQCGRRSQVNQGASSGAPTIVAPLPVNIECDDGDAEARGGGGRELKVLQISAGRAHSAAIVDGGSVYCWGSSQHGQCGNVVRRSGIVPARRVQGISDLKIAQVSCGADHTMALSTGGRVFCWGGGTEGQLGLGQMVHAQVKPRQVEELDFVAIAAGREWKQQQRSGSTKLDNDEIDDNNTKGSSSPQHLLSQLPTITKIFAGPFYSAALSSSGHLYNWGSNDAFQAGIPRPMNLPMKDNLNNPCAPTTTSTLREVHCCTFDSDHNILLPTRVDAARDMFVNDMIGGPNHMWVWGSERTPEQDDMVVGQTSYEVQERQKLRKQNRVQNSLLSKVHGLCIEDGWTEETTTQTDNEEVLQDDADRLYQYQNIATPLSIDMSETVTSEADTSRAYSSASVTPVNASRRLQSAMSPLSPADGTNLSPSFADTPNSASPSTRRRRRFSMPRMFHILSLGKHKASQTTNELLLPQQSGSLTKRKSKRNSL